MINTIFERSTKTEGNDFEDMGNLDKPLLRANRQSLQRQQLSRITADQ